jgi:hypothetical protein
MKQYKIKPTKKQLEVIKLYWKMLKAEQDKLWLRIGELERAMSKKTGIVDLEFIQDSMFGGEIMGVGNVDRTMSLLQGEDLE